MKKNRRWTEKGAIKSTEGGIKGQEGEKDGISQKCQLPLCKISRGRKECGMGRWKRMGAKEEELRD